MTKYGPQADRARRRDTKRDTELTAEEAGTWTCPTREQSDSFDDYPCMETETTRITTHVRYLGGRLAYFAIMHHTWSAGEWHEVVRIDCKHEEVHIHKFAGSTSSRGSVSRIRLLHSQADVENAYEPAYSFVMDNLDTHEREWRNA